MSCLFKKCKYLTSLNISSFDTSNVTNMFAMLEFCPSITSLDLSNFDTSNVTNMMAMFHNCASLISLGISSFDFSKVESMFQFLSKCYSLTNLKFGRHLKKDLDLSWSPLTHESALSVIDGLDKVDNKQKIIFKYNSCVTLSEEDIKKAEDKNWEIFFAKD